MTHKNTTDSRLDILEAQIKTLAKKEEVDRIQGSVKEVRDELDTTTNLVHVIEKKLMEWKRILDTLSDRIKGSLATSSGDAGVA